MTAQTNGKPRGGSPAENYQLYFVPSIGGPVANDLIAVASLEPGQRVLDVACGTGVVTRLAAERVGPSGSVIGLDPNPGMLAVARSETPPGMTIEWIEASAESMPLADAAFDVLLCQMGLQFVPDKEAALREMHRVLDSGGRALITVPGPKPPLFVILADCLARHFGPQPAAFANLVFSMHDADAIASLMRGAGFRDVDVRAKPKQLRLPPPTDFLWQYILSTPMAEAAAQAEPARRETLEREVSERWQQFVVDGGMAMEVGMTTATARK